MLFDLNRFVETREIHVEVSFSLLSGSYNLKRGGVNMEAKEGVEGDREDREEEKGKREPKRGEDFEFLAVET